MRFGSCEFVFEMVGYVFNDDDFFFDDAHNVVVQVVFCCNAVGCLCQVRSFIDDCGRVSGVRRDHFFFGGYGGFHYAGSVGYY